jgi:drug/metabolite transporter (DMT)-like permease
MRALKTKSIDQKDWKLLAILSVLWGGSFFFTGVAVRELPPFTIVLARVGLAALLLVPIHWIKLGRLPSSFVSWRAFFMMALLNNVIPFSLFVFGQREITSGLASVLNAATPLFTVLVMALFGEEKLIYRRVLGVLLGLVGVGILRAQTPLTLADAHTLGIVLCLGGALSYGFAGLWGRRHLSGVPPLTAATCQLLCSTVVVGALAAINERPWVLAPPSPATIWSLVGFACLSTALAYIIFFQILVRSGASNVMLVTLLIPVTSNLLGYFVLGEVITSREVVGGAVIASSLLLIDGRVLAFSRKPRLASLRPFRRKNPSDASVWVRCWPFSSLQRLLGITTLAGSTGQTGNGAAIGNTTGLVPDRSPSQSSD